MNSPLRDENEEPEDTGAETPESDELEASEADASSAEDAPGDVDASAELPDEDSDALAADVESLDAPDLGLVGDESDDLDAPSEQGDSVRPVEFSQVDAVDPEGNRGSIDMLMDIKLPISVELGRTETFVRDILEYGSGSVIELDKMAGDPVDILVNGRLVAKGEVVVVDDHFGVRITLLLTPEERVRSLG